MAFELSSEQQMIRLMAGDFAKKELEPMATDWDRQGTFPLQAIKKMGELGLLGMMVPTEGGSEAGAVAYPWPCRKSRIPALQAPSPCR